VINELLLGNDVIGLLPTGYGKSLCYLLPPLVTRKVMFIISPLISLMDDQKDKLSKIKIPCAALHSNNKNKDIELLNVINGKIKIVYMSPEYLINGEGMKIAEDLIKTNQLGFLAVDESHCICAWGQDFRPEYIKIKQFRKQFPTIPILAVTATATKNVCNEISTFLHLSNPILVKATFDRPNLYLNICDIPPSEIITKSKRIKQKSKFSIVLPYLSKYPNRYKMLHIKDMKEKKQFAGDGGGMGDWMPMFSLMASAGDGVLDLKGIVKKAKEVGVEHFFVEQDLVANPLVALKRSSAFLTSKI
jgi:RecQ family ATP-dependent DNA helicase